MAAKRQGGQQEVILRLANTRPASVRLRVEPWGEQHDLASGVTIEIVAHGPAEDHLELTLDDTGLTIWGWPGSVVQIVQDGVVVESAASRIPTPDTPLRQAALPAKPR